MTPFFDSWSAFWQMGNHGLYVWLSYGISVISVLALVVISHRNKAKILQEIAKDKQRQQRMKQQASTEKGL